MTLDALDERIETAVAHGQLIAGLPAEIVAAHSRSRAGREAAEIAGRELARPERVYHPEWTPAEEAQLKEWVGWLPEEEIAKRLGRSKIAIHLRWKRNMGLTAPSKWDSTFTLNQIADGFGIDVHSVVQLAGLPPRRNIPAGPRLLPPVRKLPGHRNIRVVERAALLRWMVNPMNWVYVKPERVGLGPNKRRGKGGSYDKVWWEHARRLMLRKQSLWNDEWWTIGQVAHYWGLKESNWVNTKIHRGQIKGVDWGNWHILKSEATRPGLFNHRGKGQKGISRIEGWSESADAFVVFARASGLMWDAIAKMCGRSDKFCQYRFNVLCPKGKK